MKKHGSPRKALPPGFRIVALGGGTGLSTLLRGLKERVVRRPDELSTAERPISDLAAIVTVTDDSEIGDRSLGGRKFVRAPHHPFFQAAQQRRQPGSPAQRDNAEARRQSFSRRAVFLHFQLRKGATCLFYRKEFRYRAPSGRYAEEPKLQRHFRLMPPFVTIHDGYVF